jgi:hypothetical protein
MRQSRTSGRPAPNQAPIALALAAALLGAVLTLVPAVAGAAPCRPGTEGCEDPGDGGGGDQGLPTPSVRVVDRTDTSVDVAWVVSDRATSYRLEERVGGTWTTLASFRTGGDTGFEHRALARDSHHCYRVVARRQALTRTSASACAWTKDGTALRQVWRVQIRITTGDVPDAGTDDGVRVAVHGPVNGRSGGSTRIDWARDDFERGDTFNYDLINLVGITDLGDIEGLEIHKPGTDGWCLQNVTLLVNDSAVFSTGFGDPCQWLDQGPTELVQIPHDALHDYPLWGRRTDPGEPPDGYRIPLDTILVGNIGTLVIGRDHIEGRLESQVGDAMVGTNAYWAPPDAVELTTSESDRRRATVALDLKGDVTGDDADIDVTFDLVVGTHKDDAGRWSVTIDVADADATVSPAWYHWLFVAMSAGIEISAPERQIESAFTGIAEEVGIGTFWDLDATFDDNGNLVIVATLECPLSKADCLLGGGPIGG